MYDNSQNLVKDTANESGILTIEETLQLRDKFALEYSASKGWDRFDLTNEQISEIRSNSQWKNPGLLKG